MEVWSNHLREQRLIVNEIQDVAEFGKNTEIFHECCTWGKTVCSVNLRVLNPSNQFSGRIDREEQDR